MKKPRTATSKISVAPLPVAVDGASGDRGERVLLDGVLRSLAADSDMRVLIAGSEDCHRRLRARRGCARLLKRIEWESVETSVVEGDSLNRLLRDDADTSMHRAVGALAEGRAAAALSAGSSAVLVGVAMRKLGLREGVERPAFCCRLPGAGRGGYMLDVGANVDVAPERLLQFAHLGRRFLERMGVEKPRLALINIGSELGKGNRQVQQADRMLREAEDLNYIGFIEADRLFDGEVDLNLCDGFIGNVALKTAEGVGRYALRQLSASAATAAAMRWLGGAALRRLDPRLHNGGCLLGVDGTVIKSHGGADAVAFSSALDLAWRLSRMKAA